MHIRKYDFDYSRRYFMEKTAKGVLSTGVLGSLWPMIGNTGDISKAYPDELLSVDAYTKGKVSTGDTVDANNVEHVKDLLDPVMYMQISQMGRRIKIVPSTTDVTKLFPADFLEASLRNQGQASMDANGNVITKATGGPWIGGLAFPEPKTADEIFAGLALSWGRHDTSFFGIEAKALSGKTGKVEYDYDFAWAEQNMSGLISAPDGRSILKEKLKDEMRRQTIWFSYPNDYKGTAFLSVWYNDQRKFPDLYGYLPAFKRVRRFPANQRFEPLGPGLTFFLSDAWGSGDPYLTWGNSKMVGRQPLLACQSENWNGDVDNWSKDHTLHGGPAGETFFETPVELCPDVYVIEAEPTGYPRAPVSKKRVYVDARNQVYLGYITYDRRGDLWRSFEVGFSQQTKGDLARKDLKGNPEWSWASVQSMDVQTGAMTRLNHAKEVRGGIKTGFDTTGITGTFDKYLTRQALQRLGN